MKVYILMESCCGDPFVNIGIYSTRKLAEEYMERTKQYVKEQFPGEAEYYNYYIQEREVKFE